MIRQVVVTELPKGELTLDHFEVQQVESPTPGEKEVKLKVKLMSIDAANRAWMQGATYREAIKAGDVMHTYLVGEVIETQDPRLAVGDIVAAESVWAEEVVVRASRCLKLPQVEPLTHLMSVFGVAGKTAYHGLLSVGRPQAGETVLVSAAAGSVGMYVGQIAKAMGCRAVGIAGGAEKCAYVVDELGFDACVDYRDPAWPKALRAAAPDGVDVYFDNVGGDILEATLFQMNEKGRVVCCGAISQYDGAAPSGPRNLPGMVVVKRLRMEGFIVMDFAENDAKAIEDLSAWIKDGKVKVVEDIVEGVENAPQALIGLLKGDNKGKRMVRVS